MVKEHGFQKRKEQGCVLENWLAAGYAQRERERFPVRPVLFWPSLAHGDFIVLFSSPFV